MSRARSTPASERLPEWTMRLGNRLRHLRAERGESLAAVSAATGVSASFLSVLEQGRTDVSLGRLLPLLEHYGIALSDVIESPSADPLIVRANERRHLFSAAEGVDVYLAGAGQRGAYTPLVIEYTAGAIMDSWSEHAGDEFVFVLSGEIHIDFRDADPVHLGIGDSASFASRRAHRVSAAGAKPARALIITTDRDLPGTDDQL